jgi:hypothetical protein
MFDPMYSYITCDFCNGKLQSLKQVFDESDSTVLITLADNEAMDKICREHWKNCTKETPFLDDPSAAYEGVNM